MPNKHKPALNGLSSNPISPASQLGDFEHVTQSPRLSLFTYKQGGYIPTGPKAP